MYILYPVAKKCLIFRRWSSIPKFMSLSTTLYTLFDKVDQNILSYKKSVNRTHVTKRVSDSDIRQIFSKFNEFGD